MRLLYNNHYSKIFKQGSNTFYNSSIFFPQEINKKVAILYAFVRVADDYVDDIPQNIIGFYKFRKEYEEALKNVTGNQVIDDYVKLSKDHGFDPFWTEVFLDSMEADIYKKEYWDIKETIDYMYGSAEVIGLMMCKLLKLPQASHPYARLLGRSLQFVNFIRDISEDFSRGRTYLPINEAHALGLEGLDYSSIRENRRAFIEFVRIQIIRFFGWQERAEQGYRYIPKRLLFPIKTATDMYKWTAKRVFDNPFIVFGKKVKPSKSRVIFKALNNLPMVFNFSILESYNGQDTEMDDNWLSVLDRNMSNTVLRKDYVIKQDIYSK